MNTKNKKNIEENNKQIDFDVTQQILKEGKLPNGIKPIVMSNVDEYLRSQGDISTQELLEIINKYV